MEVIVCSDAQQVAAVAAECVGRVIDRVGSKVVLGVATGSSPLGLYQELQAMVRSGRFDLSEASAFALDEYIGLPQGHPESYAETIRRTVTEPLGMREENVHVPNGFAEDIDAAADQYEQAIAQAGGVDVQILGVGSNGHIGFNEPLSSLTCRTHMVELAHRTRQDNARFFDGDIDKVPGYALTQGLGTITDARSAVLIASGSNKADAIAALVEGPVSAMMPASILQMHRDATIVVDEQAASKLRGIEQYRKNAQRYLG